MTPASAAILAGVISCGRFAGLKPAASRVYVVLLAAHAPRQTFPLDAAEFDRVAVASGVCVKRTKAAIRELYRNGLIVRWVSLGSQVGMMTDPPTS